MAAFAAVLLAGSLSTQATLSDHSFVVFFDDANSITVGGSVTAFKFTNPHALAAVGWDRGSDFIYPYECDPSFGANCSKK